MMTFEEAKDVFLNHGWIKVEGGTYFDGSKWREAIMVLSDYLQREPCDDAISRVEAISRIEVRQKITCESDPYNYYEEWINGYEAGIDDAITMINSVPSITPQPKMGNWIDDKCSVCGKGTEDLIVSPEWYRDEEPNFCPFCGVKLLKPQAESEVQDGK
jgi:hypothetical protein